MMFTQNRRVLSLLMGWAAFLSSAPVSGGNGFDDFSTYAVGAGLEDLPYSVLSGTFTEVEISYSETDQDLFELRLNEGTWQTVSAPPVALEALSPETEEWMRLDGTVLSTPIGRGQGTVIDPSKTGSMLDHRWDMMADGQGRVHGFYRRLDDQDRLQIFHFWIDADDNVHGPQPVTAFTDYTGFWQNISANATLSRSLRTGGGSDAGDTWRSPVLLLRGRRNKPPSLYPQQTGHNSGI